MWGSLAGGNPTGGAVTKGTATISGMGTPQVTIQQASQRAVISWQTFNIAPGEVTLFNQPVGGWTLNRINGLFGSSLINGALQANGSVILLNPNGVFFGPNAQVNAGGLIASTLPLAEANFLSGHYLFQGTGLEGPVRNEGTISAGAGGVYLLAPNVENTGIIRSPDGHIALAAGAKAFLSNRSDGQGFLVELAAPTDRALNLGSLVADGGQVTMAGRVVNQEGIVQANSVRQRNGRIELFASERVALTSGSQTRAAGGEDGAHGGTVIARAAQWDPGTGARTNGTVAVQAGAVVDVSPSPVGGLAGQVWLGGDVTQNGQLLGTQTVQLIPATLNVTGSVLSGLAGQSARGEVNLLAMDDITVSVPGGFGSSGFDLLALPFGQEATLYFTAGRDLTLTNSTFSGISLGVWNVAGRAGRNITLTSSQIITTGNIVGTTSSGAPIFEGGHIHLHAGNDLSLVSGGEFSKVDTSTFGGNISLTAMNNVMAANPVISDNFNLPGIHVGSPGNLTLRAGGNFVGTLSDTAPKPGEPPPPGPGFTLRGGVADVTVLGHVGTANRPMNLILGNQVFNADGTTATTETHVTITAGGSLYFNLAQDFGLRDDFNPVLTTNPNNSLSLIAKTGDIFLKPTRPIGTAQLPFTFKEALMVYPASFSATAEQGSLFVQPELGKPLSFWPSATGTVMLAAAKDISGSGPPVLQDDLNSVLFFVGLPGQPGAHWLREQRDVVVRDPELSKWFGQYGDLSEGADGGRFPLGAPPIPVGLLARPKILVSGSSAEVRIHPGDVSHLTGQPVDVQGLTVALGKPAGTATTKAMPVSLSTETGDLSGLELKLYSPAFLKQTTISSGRDIKGLAAQISVPETSDGQPIIGATISAKGNIDLDRRTGKTGSSGFRFFGTGTARIRTEGDLLLADSAGIEHSLRPTVASEFNQGGLLDIQVGGSLDMVLTKIFTFNGASIWIHGLGTSPAVDAAGRPTVLNGKPVIVEAVAQTGTDGKVTVTVDGKPVLVDGRPLVLDGSEPVVTTGSLVLDRFPVERLDGKSVMPVSYRAKPILVDGKIVLKVDGTITLMDPTLISIEQPVGGSVNVGANVKNVAEQSGIVTQRGGSITIKATKDIDVRESRIGTLRGGDIALKSTEGNINAGSGGKDERTRFVINDGVDELGRPKNILADVPGSGIFTWHPHDADFATLPFPRFNTPEMDAVFQAIVKERFLGRDTSGLEAKFDALTAARIPEYDAVFEQFITEPRPPRDLPLQLGDVGLFAAQNIIVPPAGIRGKRIVLDAGESLDLRGGQIIGKSTINVPQITGSLASFAGSVVGTVGGSSVSAAGGAGGGSVGGLSGATATVSATASATGSTSSTASKGAEQAQQLVADSSESVARQAAREAVAKTDEQGKKSSAAQTVRVKRGVTIEVDVKPQAR
jgi:filamentous hemagglutinin family protein